jgi:hypothetical protein
MPLGKVFWLLRLVSSRLVSSSVFAPAAFAARRITAGLPLGKPSCRVLQPFADAIVPIW